MSATNTIPVWKEVPLFRVLLGFVIGILLQWYCRISLQQLLVAIGAFGLAAGLFVFFPAQIRFRWRYLQGLLLTLVLITLGALVTWTQDARNEPGWYGTRYEKGDWLLLSLEEQPIEKTRSYKAVAKVKAIVHKDRFLYCQGKILLYFSKDSMRRLPGYGTMLLVARQPDPIRNSGNPGAFDYQRYAAFHQLHEQLFLQTKDWELISDANTGTAFRRFLISVKEKILAVLRTKLGPGRDELGIAEALLIGYTQDLDKDLVQAYSNTGVVHIIAISGMHLGLIYMLLLWVFARLPLVKRYAWLQALLVLTCLWLFALLTGASASVIRSAVMFTFIITGKTIFGKHSSIFGSLAASVFVMLIYDPYYLWDVGFQLSYLALTGIVVFQRPICRILYIKNKWFDKIWQLAAVSIAAQLLTFPVCIYYFHQFPNLFLFTNLLAVPLSAIILYTEIALVALAWLPVVADWLGKLVAVLVWCMNGFIRKMNDLPIATWDQLPATAFTTWLLYAVVIFGSAWLLSVKKPYLFVALFSFFVFVSAQAYMKWFVVNQQKLVIYHVPRYRALDFIRGRQYRFQGDSLLLGENWLQHFHLKPARVMMQLDRRTDSLPGLYAAPPYYQFGAIRLLLVDHAFVVPATAVRLQVDVIVVSGNPRLTVSGIAKAYDCGCYVFDASNSGGRVARWQEECSTLGIRSHAVAADGAFVQDVGM